MSHRTEQIASVLRRALQRIIDHKLNDPRLILAGALPAAALAIGVDVALGRMEELMSPRGCAIKK